MVDWNYTAPQETVSVMKKYVFNKNSKILDAGCGTGLVGIELKKYGYTNIEGVDFSQNMLILLLFPYIPVKIILFFYEHYSLLYKFIKI